MEEFVHFCPKMINITVKNIPGTWAETLVESTWAQRSVGVSEHARQHPSNVRLL